METAETCFCLAKIIVEIFGYREQTLQVKSSLKRQSLFNVVHSMTFILDKTLRVDTVILRETMQNKEIRESMLVML